MKPVPCECEPGCWQYCTADAFLPCLLEQAPGYSSVITRPMDIRTMRGLCESGHYTSWDILQDDVETMFRNAMTFNRPETPFYKQV